MKSNIIKFSFLVFFTLTSFIAISQDSWFTDLNEAKAYAKKEGKLILVEVGSIRDGESLFISNEIWNSPEVEAQLVNYVPLSLEMNYRDKFFKKAGISFSPTLMIMDDQENILFIDPGRKTIEQIAEILETINNHGKKLHKLVSTYKRGSSPIGRLQKAEEYIYLSFLTPNSMKMYFYRQSRSEIVAFEDDYSRDLKNLKNRMKIIEYGQALNAGDFYSGMARLNKMLKKDISKKDELLILFYLTLGEYIDENIEASNKYRIKLQKLSEKQVLARDYSEKLTKLLGDLD